MYVVTYIFIIEYYYCYIVNISLDIYGVSYIWDIKLVTWTQVPSVPCISHSGCSHPVSGPEGGRDYTDWLSDSLAGLEVHSIQLLKGEFWLCGSRPGGLHSHWFSSQFGTPHHIPLDVGTTPSLRWGYMSNCIDYLRVG